VTGGGRAAWDALCAAVLSSPCAICARVLEAPSRGAICATCWASVAVFSPPLCPRCGYPVSSSRVCVGCRELRALDRALALGPYEGVLRDVLHALKYAGRRSAAPVLATLLLERCPDILHGADAIVPVPLHPWRGWTRGFNQAALIAVHLGWPVWRLLRRRRHTPPQAGLSAAERRRNVRDAFALTLRARTRRPSLARAATLVLVDDVCTTGATLDACAAVLKAHGAREVRALVVARTIKGH
jgi:ComF family protein